VKYGKEFLGDDFTKEGIGRYLSKDGFRQMRFDLTHHNGLPVHINLETFSHSVYDIMGKGVRTVIENIHIFFG
jgi:hypothetical protein